MTSDSELRDYFAAAALQGLLAACGGNMAPMDAGERARYAYRQAEEMMRARDEVPGMDK